MMGVGAKRALGLYRSCAPRQPADGSGATERLTQSEPGFVQRPLSFSPDGSVLAFMRTSPTYDIYMLSLTEERCGALPPAQFSPDGKWIAYTSDESIGRYPRAPERALFVGRWSPVGPLPRG